MPFNQPVVWDLIPHLFFKKFYLTKKYINITDQIIRELTDRQSSQFPIHFVNVKIDIPNF